jgi:LuxR family transcriptional regulator, maltose regulon positive regulatory protein
MSLSGRAGAKTVLVEADEASLPFGVVAAKIRPPLQRPGVVSRTALVNRLRAGRSTRVVSVVAPGGYGKTTLLAQWAARDDRPVAWISLDRRDNDPVVFLRHVAAAINEIIPVDPLLLDALAAPIASIWTSVLPRVAALVAAADDSVLVLDDTHEVVEEESAEVLAILAGHVPDGSTFVLSSRVESVLVTRLRSSSTLLEIGAADLALTRREAELLLRNAGARLSDAAFAELIERTEGWAGALYLASLSLQRPGTGRSRAVSGSHDVSGADERYLADYFHSEYLGALPPERLRFLRRTSVLEKMSGALCDATLDWNQSFDELEALKRSNLFLVTLDEDGIWYRYHHLFRDLLRRELSETEPELAKKLGGRAADWLEQHGDAEAALEHALDVGDMDRAARIFAEIALPTYCGGRAATVELWLGRFDSSAVALNPTIAVLGARVHALRGSADEAERWLELAELHGAEDPEVAAQVAVMRASFCRDGVGTMLSDAGSAVESLPETSDWRSLALLVYAVAHTLLGDNERANEIFGDAITHARRAGFSETQVLATGERMLLSEETRDLAGSDKHADELTRLLASGLLDTSVPTAVAFAASARSQLRHGNWDNARALLNHALKLTPFLTDAVPWLAVQTRLELARTFVALRDITLARALLLEIDVIFDRRPDLGVLAEQTEGLRRALDALPALDRGKGSNLTAAEMRLMPFLPTHLSFREIGDRLHLSRNTIKTQAISVYRKLGVSTRGDAIDEAVRLGLVSETGPAREIVTT